jgi:hypothetical protein
MDEQTTNDFKKYLPVTGDRVAAAVLVLAVAIKRANQSAVPREGTAADKGDDRP